MGKTYRRDSDRKFKDFQRNKNKPVKINHKTAKRLKPQEVPNEDVENEY